MFGIQLLVVLMCILLGSRVGGIGLGAFSSLGLIVFAFIFHIRPTSPPVDVLLMILSVITASSVMQAAGGLDYMVNLAEKVLKKRPEKITYIAPIISYFFTFISGTGHIIYAILPVISEVAREAKVRPERPLSVAVIASQQAITASPISAATISLLSMLSPFDISLLDIMFICVPSTLLGSMIAAFCVKNKGLDLEKDPEYQKIKKTLKKQESEGKILNPQMQKRAALSLVFFFSATLIIIFFGAFDQLRPAWEENGKLIPLSMPTIIELSMLSTAILSMVFLDVSSNAAIKGSVASAGFIAIISIFGIAWLGDTFASANAPFIHASIGSLVSKFPWLFSLALFVLSILLYSQAATTLALMPVGVAVHISPSLLIAMFPAVNGYFFLPTYGTLLAAIAFDRTGSTKIGSYLLNHSFMRAGMVATISSVLIGLALSQLKF